MNEKQPQLTPHFKMEKHVCALLALKNANWRVWMINVHSFSCQLTRSYILTIERWGITKQKTNDSCTIWGLKTTRLDKGRSGYRAEKSEAHIQMPTKRSGRWRF